MGEPKQRITKEMLADLPKLHIFPKDKSHPFDRWVASSFFGLDPKLNTKFGAFRRFQAGVYELGMFIKGSEYADLAALLTAPGTGSLELRPAYQTLKIGQGDQAIMATTYQRYDSNEDAVGFCYVDVRWNMFLTDALKDGFRIRQLGKGMPIEIYQVSHEGDMVYGYVMPCNYKGSETPDG